MGRRGHHARLARRCPRRRRGRVVDVETRVSFRRAPLGVALQAAHLIAHRTGRNPRGGCGSHALVCRAHVPSATSAGMRTHARSPVSQRASLLLVPQVPRLSSLNRCDACRRASHVSPRPSCNRRPRECENRSSDGPRSSPRLAAHIQTRCGQSRGEPQNRVASRRVSHRGRTLEIRIVHSTATRRRRCGQGGTRARRGTRARKKEQNASQRTMRDSSSRQEPSGRLVLDALASQCTRPSRHSDDHSTSFGRSFAFTAHPRRRGRRHW